MSYETERDRLAGQFKAYDVRMVKEKAIFHELLKLEERLVQKYPAEYTTDPAGPRGGRTDFLYPQDSKFHLATAPLSVFHSADGTDCLANGEDQG